MEDKVKNSRDLARKLFDGIALRVDQFFKSNNILGGVRQGSDLFSTVDEYELAKTIDRYSESRQAQEAPKADKVTISDEALAQFSCWDSWDKTHTAFSSIARELLAYRRQAQEAPKDASVQNAEEFEKSSAALTYILSALAKNVWMGTKGEKEYIRAVGEFEENATGHIKRYFKDIAAAQRQAGREEAFSYYGMISTYPNLPDGDERKKAYFCGVADATKPDARKGE